MTKSNKVAKVAPVQAAPAKGKVKGKAKAVRVGQTKFANDAAITVLPKGKVNPRRKNTGPFKRYAVLLKSRTVAQFLKVLPQWRSTINRAQSQGYIRVG